MSGTRYKYNILAGYKLLYTAKISQKTLIWPDISFIPVQNDMEFVIEKKYAGEVDTKLNVFRSRTKTRKTLFPTMITTYGTKENEYYLGRIQNEVVMNDLFQ